MAPGPDIRGDSPALIEDGIRPSRPDLRTRVERRTLERIARNAIFDGFLKKPEKGELSIDDVLTRLGIFCMEKFGFLVEWPDDDRFMELLGNLRNLKNPEEPEDPFVFLDENNRRNDGIMRRLNFMVPGTSEKFSLDAEASLLEIGVRYSESNDEGSKNHKFSMKQVTGPTGKKVLLVERTFVNIQEDTCDFFGC